MASSFYVPDGEGFSSTVNTRGPWSPEHQHAGPPCALLARAVERCGSGSEVRVGRITFEILRPVPITTLTAHAEIVRPGRQVDLVESELHDADGPVILARAWRLRAEAVAGVATPPEPPGHAPEDGREVGFFEGAADVGYHTAMEARFVDGSFRDPGPATVWMRMRIPLVADEEPSGLQRVLAAADSGNGVSAVLDPTEHLFVNTDLTVRLARYPRGEWVCLDSVTRIDGDGIGLAESVLYDEADRLGGSSQTLYVSRRR